MTIIQKIKERIPIAEIARRYVPDLKDHVSGKRLLGSCPFHEQRTGSFNIDPVKGRFHCYSCGRHGDLIELVEEVEGLSKKDAIHKLALEAGIEPETKTAPTEQQKQEQRLKKAFSAAQDAYSQGLWAKDSPGLHYMRNRGVSDDTLKEFEVGFSPASYSKAVSAAVQKSGVSIKEALDFNVLAKSSKGNVYDPMFGRVVFPIYSEKQHLVGFGGRIIDKDSDVAKYKNTSSFQKGAFVFGLKQAVPHIRRSGKAIVVEGYMDVLAMHQAGFKNCVGTMGTAITTAQLHSIRKHCPCIIFLMDGDSAGQTATMQALDRAIKAGFNVQVALLPDGADPDDFVRKNGHDSMQALLNEAVCGLEMWLRHLDETSAAELSCWVGDFLKAVADPIAKIVWAKRIGKFLGVSAQELLDAVAQATTAPSEDKEAV